MGRTVPVKRPPTEASALSAADIGNRHAYGRSRGHLWFGRDAPRFSARAGATQPCADPGLRHVPREGQRSRSMRGDTHPGSGSSGEAARLPDDPVMQMAMRGMVHAAGP